MTTGMRDSSGASWRDMMSLVVLFLGLLAWWWRRHEERAGATDTGEPIPHCPSCARRMVLRRAPSDIESGSVPFWRCAVFPRCRATLPL